VVLVSSARAWVRTIGSLSTYTPDVVYLEHLTSAIYLDKRRDVDRYLQAMERLCAQAEARSRTPSILAGIRDVL
jgi:Domain of unknown function (DUF5753)